MKKHRLLFMAAALVAVSLSNACSLIYDSESSDISSDVFETSTENSSSIDTDLGFVSEPEISDVVDGIVIPTKFSTEDKNLQNILIQKGTSAIEHASWFGGMLHDYDIDGELDLIDFIFAESDIPYYYYRVAERFPQTVEEMEKELSRYFTAEVTAVFMKQVSKGTMTENSDGTFLVEFPDGGRSAKLIEIDGKMYCLDGMAGGVLTDIYWNTAKVTEHTDDTIVFTYIYASFGELTEGKGRLKKEGGDWKFEYCEGWL